jgi:signal transduction histidine kinase
VRVDADGDRVQIQVIDTGSGIPADVLPRIFDELYTTKEYGRGTGLGLAIVKEAVEEGFGGQIEVATTPGVGTTFTVRIPCAKGISQGV